MMTDERQSEALWPALERLPRGSGVVVRHYSLSEAERRRLIARVRGISRRRGLVLVVAGSARLARRVRADGFHGRSAKSGAAGLIRTMPVHDAAELAAAERAGADLIFVSPIFATQSHPRARTLGRLGLAKLATRTRIPVVALGGMTRARAGRLGSLGIYGWAAIGALTP